jgi:hypothetical protein
MFVRRLHLASTEATATGATLLHFTAHRPLGHRAGQHAIWLVPGGGGAPFTVASASDEKVVTLATVLHRQNRIKRP